MLYFSIEMLCRKCYNGIMEKEDRRRGLVSSPFFVQNSQKTKKKGKMLYFSIEMLYGKCYNGIMEKEDRGDSYICCLLFSWGKEVRQWV